VSFHANFWFSCLTRKGPSQLALRRAFVLA
jgi:hypothetical protein